MKASEKILEVAANYRKVHHIINKMRHHMRHGNLKLFHKHHKDLLQHLGLTAYPADTTYNPPQGPAKPKVPTEKQPETPDRDPDDSPPGGGPMGTSTPGKPQ